MHRQDFANHLERFLSRRDVGPIRESAIDECKRVECRQDRKVDRHRNYLNAIKLPDGQPLGPPAQVMSSMRSKATRAHSATSPSTQI